MEYQRPVGAPSRLLCQWDASRIFKTCWNVLDGNEPTGLYWEITFLLPNLLTKLLADFAARAIGGAPTLMFWLDALSIRAIAVIVVHVSLRRLFGQDRMIWRYLSHVHASL